MASTIAPDRPRTAQGMIEAVDAAVRSQIATLPEPNQATAREAFTHGFAVLCKVYVCVCVCYAYMYQYMTLRGVCMCVYAMRCVPPSQSLTQCLEVSDAIAPEHLELSVEDPQSWLPSVRHAGAIFLGRYSAEALGDYCAGPNHVLPTSGTARFSSPLGVYDFQKRSSLIMCSAEGIRQLAPIVSTLARGESLQAHALSAEYRVSED